MLRCDLDDSGFDAWACDYPARWGGEPRHSPQMGGPRSPKKCLDITRHHMILPLWRFQQIRPAFGSDEEMRVWPTELHLIPGAIMLWT